MRERHEDAALTSMAAAVDYCVTTMDRPQALERLLLSIAARDPDARVHVADQSENFDAAAHERLAERLCGSGAAPPTIYRLPADCGVSAARNHLVEVTAAERKLILDDDFVFGEKTDVGALTRLLDAHPEAGVAGGGILRNDGRVRGGSLLLREGTGLRQVRTGGPFIESGGSRTRWVDFVPNFALMRAELFDELRWDPTLKISGEHLDFFLRMRETSYGVLFTPDVTIGHPPIESTRSYQARRLRGEFLKRTLDKHGIARLETPDGMVTEIHPDGRMTREQRVDGA